MNKVILIGRITKDLELKYTNSSIPFVRFTIAVNRIYQSKDGEKQTDFINCVAWKNQAENLVKFMRKGSLIGIEGQIQTSSYEDQQGVRKYNTDILVERIEFLSTNKDNNSTSNQQSNIGTTQQVHDVFENNNLNQDVKSPYDFDVSNDDLPF